MEKGLNIYAVIVTYNGMKWVERCLDSLRQSTYPITPIVIDNLSTDGSKEYIPSHFPEVIWLPQEKNLGFGQGNNVGMRYALEHDADYVLLLNQDAYLHKDSIKKYPFTLSYEPHNDGMHDKTRTDRCRKFHGKP